MSQENSATSTAPRISADVSMGAFLDKHPCGDQIRRSVQEHGIAEIAPDAPVIAPRIPKPR